MALRLEEKKTVVKEIASLASEAVVVITADYRGLTVAELTELRAQARAAGLVLRVVKNSLSRLAFKGTAYECLEETLTGPIILLFSSEDPGVAARIMRDFAKQHDALEVKALSMAGQLLAVQQLAAVASLPTRDEALAQLMSVMMAPVTKLVRTMAEPYAQAVRVMAAVGDQKQAT